MWVAVEDGRIAPPGTHLQGALFRWMYPSLIIDKPSAAKSCLVPSAAHALSSVTGSGCDTVTADGVLGDVRVTTKKRKSASSRNSSKSKSSRFAKVKLPVIDSTETGDEIEVETNIVTEMESKGTPSTSPVEKTTRLLPLTLCAVLKENEKMDPVDQKIAFWDLLKDCRLAGVPAPPPPLEDLDIFHASEPEYSIFDKEVHVLPADTSSPLIPQTDSTAPVLSCIALFSAADSKSSPTVAASALTKAVDALDHDIIPALTMNLTQSIQPSHAAKDTGAASPETSTAPPLSMQSIDDGAGQEVTEDPFIHTASDWMCRSANTVADPSHESALDGLPPLIPLPVQLVPVTTSSEYVVTPLSPLPSCSLTIDLQRTAQHMRLAAELTLPEGNELDSTARAPAPSPSCCLVSCHDLDSRPSEGAAPLPTPTAESILTVCEPRHATSLARPSCCVNTGRSIDVAIALTLQTAAATTDTAPDPPLVSTLSVSDSTSLLVCTCDSANDVAYPYVTLSHDDAAEDAASDAATSADCSSQYQDHCRCLLDSEPLAAPNDCTNRDIILAEGSTQEYWVDNEHNDKCLGASSWLARESGVDYGMSELSSERSPAWRRSLSSHDSLQESVITKSERRSRDGCRDRQPDDTGTDHSRSRSTSEEAESCRSQRNVISYGEGVQGYLPDCLDQNARDGLMKRWRDKHFMMGCGADEGSPRDDDGSERERSGDREFESARWKGAEEALGRERERKRWRTEEEVVAAIIEAVKRKRRGEGGPD